MWNLTGFPTEFNGNNDDISDFNNCNKGNKYTYKYSHMYKNISNIAH